MRCFSIISFSTWDVTKIYKSLHIFAVNESMRCFPEINLSGIFQIPSLWDLSDIFLMERFVFEISDLLFFSFFTADLSYNEHQENHQCGGKVTFLMDKGEEKRPVSRRKWFMVKIYGFGACKTHNLICQLLSLTFIQY